MARLIAAFMLLTGISGVLCAADHGSAEDELRRLLETIHSCDSCEASPAPPTQIPHQVPRRKLLSAPIREHVSANPVPAHVTRLEGLLDQVWAASRQPELELWLGRPGLNEPPRFVVESRQNLAAAVRDDEPLILIGKEGLPGGIHGDDEEVFALSHEMMHLLLGQLEARKSRLEKLCSALGTPDPLKCSWSIELTHTPTQAEEDYRRFLREQEAVADAWAWRLTELAGYNPHRGVAWLERLVAEKGITQIDEWPEHYPPEMRLQDLAPYRRGPWLPPPAVSDVD
jgi:hypothetical protein